MLGSVLQETTRISLIVEWLEQGWLDFRRVPWLSALYAALFLVVGLVAVSGLLLGGFSLVYFIFAGGFLIVVPVFAAIYYTLADKMKQGLDPVPSDLVGGIRNCPYSVLVIGLVSLVIYLIWITDAMIIYSVYFDFVPISWGEFQQNQTLKMDALAFLLFAGILGFVLTFIVYCVTVLSIPYAIDKRSDLVRAVSFSVKAVSRHPRLMFPWALVLGGGTLLTVLFALPLLIIVLPIFAYANHALYRDMLPLMGDF